MKKCQNFILIFFFLFSLHGSVLSDEPCESGWQPYKDEKCLKIFDAPGLLDYTDAETFCKEQDDASLLSIGFHEKQIFLEDFLKSEELADNVWIGLKFTSNGTYEWSDGTDYLYENWAPGSPKNDSGHCVQIQSDEVEFGKWSDVLCTKRNLVLCEKLQLWSLSRLQTTVINLMKNPFPIGFIYVQLPKEKAPIEIWPWMTWADVSSDYAGVFFRVEGGNASSFGDIQEEDSPRLIKSTITTVNPGIPWENPIPADGKPHIAFFNWDGSTPTRFLNLTVSASEVRPRNMAIRIWKRTE